MRPTWGSCTAADEPARAKRLTNILRDHIRAGLPDLSYKVYQEILLRS